MNSQLEGVLVNFLYPKSTFDAQLENITTKTYYVITFLVVSYDYAVSLFPIPNYILESSNDFILKIQNTPISNLHGNFSITNYSNFKTDIYDAMLLILNAINIALDGYINNNVSQRGHAILQYNINSNNFTLNNGANTYFKIYHYNCQMYCS